MRPALKPVPSLEDETPDARDIIAKHAGLGSSPYYLADRIIAELSKAGFAIVEGAA